MPSPSEPASKFKEGTRVQNYYVVRNKSRKLVWRKQAIVVVCWESIPIPEKNRTQKNHNKINTFTKKVAKRKWVYCAFEQHKKTVYSQWCGPGFKQEIRKIIKEHFNFLKQIKYISKFKLVSKIPK